MAGSIEFGTALARVRKSLAAGDSSVSVTFPFWKKRDTHASRPGGKRRLSGSLVQPLGLARVLLGHQL